MNIKLSFFKLFGKLNSKIKSNELFESVSEGHLDKIWIKFHAILDMYKIRPFSRMKHLQQQFSYK